MADANRKLVDKGILHHAVTPTWEEKSKAQIAQWFSDNGFARGYSSNPANWSGLINPYTGQRSYSQAHFAAQRVDERTPDATDTERLAGFRLVQLVADPWGVITWGAGNWPINQSCLNTEFLGDYRNISLRENDCKVIADFFRPRDRELSGRLAIFGHKEVTTTGTACPANIMNARARIVELINAPDSGWPAPTPPPIVTPPTPPVVTQTTNETYDPAKIFEVVSDTHLQNIPDGSDATPELYATGRIIENVVELSGWSNGLSFYRTAYSKQNNIARGFRNDTLKEVIAQSPEPPTEPETPTEPIDPTPEPPIVTEPPEGQPKPPSWFVAFLQWLLSHFKPTKK